MTPIRRLEGITYWVIENPDGIYDFINKEIRKEWEADARSEGRDPKKDQWLRKSSKRKHSERAHSKGFHIQHAHKSVNPQPRKRGRRRQDP